MLDLSFYTPSSRLALPVAALAFAAVAAAQPFGPGGPSGAQAVPRGEVIVEPGHYVLNRPVGASANQPAGITIRASDVTLDLNGFAVTGPGGLQGAGIVVEGVRGVVVRNGGVANFGVNVRVANSQNVVLENLQIRGQGLGVNAPPPEIGIMIAQSAGVVVRNNTITNTGLGIFVRGGDSRGNFIEGNTVTATQNGVLAICYNPAATDPRGPRGDAIVGNHLSGFNVGVQMSDMSMYNVIRDNTVAYNAGGRGFDLLDDTNVLVDNTSVPLP